MRVVVVGPDAAEVAAILKIPGLPGGRHGWEGLSRAAAVLRQLRVQELQHQMGYEVEVRLEPSDSADEGGAERP